MTKLAEAQLLRKNASDRYTFMQQCVDVMMDESDGDAFEAQQLCEMLWDEGSDLNELGNPMTVIRKTHSDVAQKGMEFVLSDATPDRYGDVIDADGWDLKNFSNNPVALFNHNPDFPIGKWTDLRVIDGALRGHLHMAPAGTSARIDEIRNLIDAGILRAVSVGFLPIERESYKNGQRYVKSELVETSLVAIPANPNALAVAKALNISRETLDVVFAKNGEKDPQMVRRGSRGEHAETSPVRGNRTMSHFAKRIEDAQTRINSLKDNLDAHLASVDDETPDDDATKITEELTERIERQQQALEVLKRAEIQLAQKTANENGLAVIDRRDRGSEQPMEVRERRPFAMPATKVEPVDHIWRSVAVALKHHAEGKRRTILDVLKETYGDQEQGEMTRKVMASLVTRTAVVPADTVTSYWAKELVGTVLQGFLDALHPVSIYPKLAARGGSYTFGTNGTIVIPGRDATPTIAGAFIAQGAAIPVKKGAFNSITLTPKKLGVITTMTREITEHSQPAIEGILRKAILDDTAVAIDTALLANQAATVTLPQGLQNAAGSALSATGAGATPLVAMLGDITTMLQDLTTNTSGNVRDPVWIMNPSNAILLKMQQAANGTFPFRDEMNGGTLMGYPVIYSTTGTADTMYLLDAADFSTATGSPRFDVSDQALLHEETSPLPIDSGSTTTPVQAAPLRSLWQTDTLGIRLLWDIDWAFVRQGNANWITSLSWN